MRGASTIRRIGGSVVLAAALAGAAAGPAGAAIGPACTTRLVAADAGTSAQCTFDAPRDWSTISIVPNGTVTATLRCQETYGYVFTSTYTVSQATAFADWTPGTCTLTLAAVSPGATAHASATPTTGPLFEDVELP